MENPKFNTERGVQKNLNLKRIRMNPKKLKKALKNRDLKKKEVKNLKGRRRTTALNKSE